MAYFSFLVLAPTGLAVSASSTTPVLKLLLERALRFPQAKEMERFTAYLAEDKLHAEREEDVFAYKLNFCVDERKLKRGEGKKENQDDAKIFTSTFPLLAHKKQSTLGVIGTEVSRLRPPASHTFSTSWFLLKSTLIRCTPSQGALEFTWPLVEGVLCEFKVLLLGGLVVRGFTCSPDTRGGDQKKQKQCLTNAYGKSFDGHLIQVKLYYLVFWFVFRRKGNRARSWLL